MVKGTKELEVVLQYGSLTGRMSSRFALGFSLGRGHSRFAVWRRAEKKVAVAHKKLLSVRDACYVTLVQEISGLWMAYA